MVERVHSGVLKTTASNVAVPTLPNRSRTIINHVEPGRKGAVGDQLPGQVLVSKLREGQQSAMGGLNARGEMILIPVDSGHQVFYRCRSQLGGEELEVQGEG